MPGYPVKKRQITERGLTQQCQLKINAGTIKVLKNFAYNWCRQSVVTIPMREDN